MECICQCTIPCIRWNAFVNALFHVSGGMYLSVYYSMHHVKCICPCAIPCITVTPWWSSWGRLYSNVLFHVSPWPPDGPAEEGYTAMCYSMYHRDPLMVQLRKATQQCAIPCITVTPWWSSWGRLYSNVLFHVSPWPPDGPAEEGYTAMCYSMYHRDPLTVQPRKAIQQQQQPMWGILLETTLGRRNAPTWWHECFVLSVLTCALSLGCTGRFSETAAPLHGSHTWVCNRIPC